MILRTSAQPNDLKTAAQPCQLLAVPGGAAQRQPAKAVAAKGKAAGRLTQTPKTFIRA